MDATKTGGDNFRPGLIVVDFQEDFCPPNGSLAVKEGRDIAPVVNELLSLPFVARIATRDWHPEHHVSFASNHEPPHNKPFESEVDIVNPANKEEIVRSQLWPVHCVAGQKGSELVPELRQDLFTHTINKGTNPHIETYSAFGAPFSNPPFGSSGLAEQLRVAGATHVYVVGLAYDYCVLHTALDAAKEGFETYVVRDGTKPVDAGNISRTESRLYEGDVKVVGANGHEIDRVRALASV